ncbi:unnamed protein product [Auanema sp. JU1783]|nr:unnamed protein product [Auanema sp. JU1783]
MESSLLPKSEMRMIFLLLILVGLSLEEVSASVDIHETGGTSISGMSVTCFDKMENCLEACYMSCYYADSCNDSSSPAIACAPGLRTSVFLFS